MIRINLLKPKFKMITIREFFMIVRPKVGGLYNRNTFCYNNTNKASVNFLLKQVKQ